MNKEHIRIKELTEEFISESIKNENPKGLCFATSYPLKIYLLTKNIRTKLRAGKVPNPLPDNPNFENDHFWLQIDSEGTILDPTIIQFSGDLYMPIYIGKLDANETTRQYKVSSDLNKIWFPQVYNTWRTPFIDRTFPLNEFSKKSIVYQIKLASILHLEMNRLQNQDDIINKHYQNYFGPIFKFLRDWKNGSTDIEIDEKQMHPNFDKMLSEALAL